MNFKDFIQEATEKHASMAFMRANPPTTGHSLVVDKAKEVAAAHGVTHHVILSHSQDKAKNPLSSQQKLKHAKRFFPDTKLSVSNKEHPTFLHHAAKLHQQGVTHLHMIAGSDRVKEYKEKLAQYNGTHEGALYNFKKITVHSAGERDPDAEGTTGISGSKMRGHAAGGNFKEFKKGVPAHVPEHHAKEMFHDVRKGMGVKEDVDATFEELLSEGVHDKGIFKAVFLAGGPGSGKDYVLDNTLAGNGLTEINSDKALEFLMDKKGLNKTMPASERIERDLVRGKAKNMTELRQRLALQGRNGLIINGTGDDPEKIKKIKERLEELGYETSCIVVNTRDEVSSSRNVERGSRGGRTVPEPVRKSKWDAVQNARPELAKLFGQNFVEFDNSEDLRSARPEIVQAKKEEMLNIYKGMQKFIKAPPKSEQAKAWVAGELNKKDAMPISKKTDAQPHPDSAASEQARKLGLQYYGFGRYGKEGKVTYRSVHDKLVAVPKDEPKQVNVPISGSSMKKVNEEFEEMFAEGSKPAKPTALERFRAAAAERQRKHDEIEKNQSKDGSGMSSSIDRLEKHLNKESNLDEGGFTAGWRDKKYFGKGVPTNRTMTAKEKSEHLAHKQKQKEIDDLMKKESHEINHKHLLKDTDGKVRKYMLRRSAAKEAHINGGVVHKVGNGYVIKIKENEDVESNIKPIQEQQAGSKARSTERLVSISSTSTSNQEKTSCEESHNTKGKITLSQIRAKKENQQEAIDCGIEPGMSMAAGGESIGRDMGEKIKKRKIDVAEDSGDQTTASIGDQKEDELKKKGIDLLSFRKRNYAL